MDIIVKIISLKLKNYKSFIDAKFTFNNTEKQNVSHITGTNGSGKTTLINAILWCLYGLNESSDEIIPNKQVFYLHNEPTTVKAEMILDDNDKRYIITRTQVFYSCNKFDNAALTIKCTDINTKKSHKLSPEEITDFINDFFPDYIVKYLFLDNEKYSYKTPDFNTIIFDFIKNLKHDTSFNTDLNEIYSLLNVYINNFFKSLTKKEYIKIYFDEKYKFHVLDQNGEDYIRYFGNTEIRICSCYAVLFAMIKTYEKLKNKQLFIVLEQPQVLDKVCNAKFLSTLVSSFSQIILISNDSLLPDFNTCNLSDCVSNKYFIQYIHHSKITKL